MAIRWHYDFDLEQYETEPRGAWVGMVWGRGERWKRALLHTPTMQREDLTIYPDRDTALESIEALLLERVPTISGTSPSSGSRRPPLRIYTPPTSTPPIYTLSAAVIRRDRSRCPHCGIPVKRLQKHLRKVHGQVSTPQVSHKETKRRQSGRNTASAQRQDNTFTEARRTAMVRESSRDPHDASRLYAERYRDHGQFGSYPVHDDYGDESMP